MTNIMEKILLGVFVVFFVGLGAGFLNAQFQEEPTKTNVVVKDISIDEAKQIALNAVQGNIVKVDLEQDELFPKYEITMQNGNNFIEVEINARTGNILELETVGKDDKELTVDEVSALGGQVTQEEAKQIALDHIKGGIVIDVEAEREHGLLLYGVTIQKGVDKIEVEVNAETGAIMEVEWNED